MDRAWDQLVNRPKLSKEELQKKTGQKSYATSSPGQAEEDVAVPGIGESATWILPAGFLDLSTSAFIIN